MMDDVPHFIRAIRSAVQIIGLRAFGVHYFNQIAGALRAPVDSFSSFFFGFVSQQLHTVLEVSMFIILLLGMFAALSETKLSQNISISQKYCIY